MGHRASSARASQSSVHCSRRCPRWPRAPRCNSATRPPGRRITAARPCGSRPDVRLAPAW